MIAVVPFGLLCITRYPCSVILKLSFTTISFCCSFKQYSCFIFREYLASSIPCRIVERFIAVWGWLFHFSFHFFLDIRSFWPPRVHSLSNTPWNLYLNVQLVSWFLILGLPDNLSSPGCDIHIHYPWTVLAFWLFLTITFCPFYLLFEAITSTPLDSRIKLLDSLFPPLMFCASPCLGTQFY